MGKKSERNGRMGACLVFRSRRPRNTVRCMAVAQNSDLERVLEGEIEGQRVTGASLMMRYGEGWSPESTGVVGGEVSCRGVHAHQLFDRMLVATGGANGEAGEQGRRQACVITL